jgi:chemotaxis protein methyltransferase CheR
VNPEQLAQTVTERTGIVVTSDASLARAIARLAARHHELGGDDLVQRVVDEFTIKETWFLREDAPLRALPWAELLRRAQRRGDDAVTVWSAACATGEEPYSLALLACEAFGTATPSVRILGTDVSAAALAAASAGRYRSRSTRAVPAEWRARWFVADGDELRVGDELRALVSFRQHNLLHDAYGRFDVVLCRNVLIYFDAPTATEVRARLASSVHDGGRLVLGSADVLCGVAVPPVPQPKPVRPRRPRRPRPSRPQREETAVDWFERGVAHLDRDDAAAAVEPLRRALYLEPGFALAAFQLGRAYDRLGQPAAAVRLYHQTLRTLDPHDTTHDELLSQVDLGDVAAACVTRIRQEESR